MHSPGNWYNTRVKHIVGSMALGLITEHSFYCIGILLIIFKLQTRRHIVYIIYINLCSVLIYSQFSTRSMIQLPWPWHMIYLVPCGNHGLSCFASWLIHDHRQRALGLLESGQNTKYLKWNSDLLHTAASLSWRDKSTDLHFSETDFNTYEA